MPYQSYDILLATQSPEEDKPAPGTVETEKELDKEEMEAAKQRGRGRARGRGSQRGREGSQAFGPRSSSSSSSNGLGHILHLQVARGLHVVRLGFASAPTYIHMLFFVNKNVYAA